MYKLKVIALVLLILFSSSLLSQNNNKITLDNSLKLETIKKISSLLRDNYVFPEVAKSMSDYLNAQLSGGVYENITEPMKFADKLTENGKLWYQRKGRPKMQMTAMTEDTFMFNDVEYFRLRFVKDAGGSVTEVNGLYDNGDVDKSLRTN